MSQLQLQASKSAPVVKAPEAPKAVVSASPFKSCDCHPEFEASQQGQIRDAVSKKVVKTFVRRSTKHTCVSNKAGDAVEVCKLVADAYLPKPASASATLEHKNGNKLDNNVSNLHYVMPKPVPAPKVEEKKPAVQPKAEEKKKL